MLGITIASKTDYTKYKTFISSIHNRVLRADGRLIHISTDRTEIANRSFVVGSARLWNTLPSHIRKSRSLSSFHYSLKVHLLGGVDCITGWFIDSPAGAGSGLGAVGLVIYKLCIERDLFNYLLTIFVFLLICSTKYPPQSIILW